MLVLSNHSKLLLPILTRVVIKMVVYIASDSFACVITGNEITLQLLTILYLSVPHSKLTTNAKVIEG